LGSKAAFGRLFAVLEREGATVRETYHIETIAPEADGGGVIHRISVRLTEEAARERALRVFHRATVPQARGPAVDSVRVLNGAGYEVFTVSVRD
jgi:hypothetical protein